MDRDLEPYEKALDPKTPRIPKKKVSPVRDPIEERMREITGDQQPEENKRYTSSHHHITDRNIQTKVKGPTIVLGKEKSIVCSPSKKDEIVVCHSSPSMSTLPQNQVNRRRKSLPSNRAKEKFTWSISPVREENFLTQKRHRSRRDSFDKISEYSGPETRSRSRSRSRSTSIQRDFGPETRSRSKSRPMSIERDIEENNRKNRERSPSITRSRHQIPQSMYQQSRNVVGRKDEKEVNYSYHRSRSCSRPRKESSVEPRSLSRRGSMSNDVEVLRRLRDRSKSREPERYSPSLYDEPKRSTSRCKRETENAKHRGRDEKNLASDKNFKKRALSSQRRSIDEKEYTSHKDKPSAAKNSDIRSRARSVEPRKLTNSESTPNHEVLRRLRDRSKSREPERFSPSTYSQPKRSVSQSHRNGEKTKHHGRDERSHHKRASSSQRERSMERQRNHKDMPNTSKMADNDR